MIPTWLRLIAGGGSPTPPEPGPLSIAFDDEELTTYTKEFGLAYPQAVVGLAFRYTGTPVFTVTHGGEPLDVYTELNPDSPVGAFIAVGKGLTVETADLIISCTGGTFGCGSGRVNEIEFDFTTNWTQGDSGLGIQTATLSGGNPNGTIFATAVFEGNHSNPAVFNGLTRVAWGYSVTGTPQDMTSPGSMNGWTAAGGGWTHSGSAESPLAPFTFNPLMTATVYASMDIAVRGDAVFRIGLNNNANYAVTDFDGLRILRLTNSGSNTTGIITGQGNVTVRSVKFYNLNQKFLIASFGRGKSPAVSARETYAGNRYYSLAAVSLLPL